ncbi:unnamed protein product [Mycena citricolor]|uniref:Mediator of RNA polymerase II transcription subunit 19 n=1 Tax=Mycena citricolor TaxID=2018698 RepID=A0AAD2H3I0_9AGAR|nr:unnamed protein product [Mycena citricolor]CAK5269151.1 unnamed protein product [Mycena citricolor]
MVPQQNAEAGPSTVLYLKPKAPPHPAPRLASTQDLLARFQLIPAYDKYVRGAAEDFADAPDKGKGKARELNGSPVPQTPGDQEPDDEDGGLAKGEKKKKNSYKHLIKGVPGRHSMKKDDYLTTIMQMPPKQHVKIVKFDERTQQEAFQVSPEGLKGWNTAALIQESAQAREDRKKRKELKRLAKQQIHNAQSGIAAPSPAAGSVGTPRPSASTPRTTAGTPRGSAGTPRPSVPPVMVPGRVGTPQRKGTGTPTSSLGTGTPTSAHPERSLKRERELEPHANGMPSGASGMNGAVGSAANGGGTVPVITAAKAGIAGARPRPVKKQRVVRGPMLL